MKRSFLIVSLITLIASTAVVHANEQAPASSETTESVKLKKVKTPLPSRNYWAAKSWDAGSKDFWHAAKREVISLDKAATTKAALRLRKQQQLRGE